VAFDAIQTHRPFSSRTQLEAASKLSISTPHKSESPSRVHQIGCELNLLGLTLSPSWILAWWQTQDDTQQILYCDRGSHLHFWAVRQTSDLTLAVGHRERYGG